jgi:hypothetical protein
MQIQARKIRGAFAKNICKEGGCEFSSRLSVCLSVCQLIQTTTRKPLTDLHEL